MITGAPLIAAALSVVLAVVALLRPPRHLRQIMFASGMAAFTLESLLVQGLLVYSNSPESHATWMGALESASLLTPIPWCLFAFLAGREAHAPVPRV